MAQMKLHTYDLFNLILIIGFLCSSKLACGTEGVHKRAAISLLPFTVKKSVSFALVPRLASNQRARPWVLSQAKTATLTEYLQIVNSLLWAYTTSKNIAGAGDKSLCSLSPQGKPQHNRQTSWVKEHSDVGCLQGTRSQRKTDRKLQKIQLAQHAWVLAIQKVRQPTKFCKSRSIFDKVTRRRSIQRSTQTGQEQNQNRRPKLIEQRFYRALD